MAKQKQSESKFAPGQVVRLTDEGLAKYRGDPREEMTVIRSGEGMASVRFRDGDEAVYEEQYLEAV